VKTGFVVAAGCTLAALASRAGAQCLPGEDSNEAKLLAHYSAPITFAPLAEPGFAAGRFVLGGDVTYIPKPDPALERTGRCFMPKKESTQLSPVFPRPRLMIGLPLGIGIEVSYLPPVRVAGAKANLVSGAVSVTRPLLALASHPVIAAARVHATRGYVNGAITCGADALQQSDPAAPCYGTQESHDTFRPNMWGIDGSIGEMLMAGRLGLYAGGGFTWLAPRFRVGFNDANGFIDRTRVEVDLHRAAVFGGATYRLAGIWSATAQVYSVPADVTLFRVGATANLGRVGR
jgi:hypothetical protein